MTGEQPRYPTGLGTSDRERIYLLGHDLADELMGQVGFGELALWLMTQDRPEPSKVRVFEAVLAALADHGFTPTAIAAPVVVGIIDIAAARARRRSLCGRSSSC